LIIYPAIDLKDGNCVRLRKGNLDDTEVFNKNPIDQAKYFESIGFKWLHIVDLNGAVLGKLINILIIESIINNTNLRIQLGGGIRDIETIDLLLDKGLSRIIIGTSAVKNPSLVKLACKKYPGKIIVGIDAKDGLVATDGWLKKSNLNYLDLAKEYEDSGVSTIIYTDIDRDGMMEGINFESIQLLASKINIPIIASGGISTLSDIEKLKSIEDKGISGAIIGRALYNKAINPFKVIKIAKDKNVKK